MPWLTKKKPQSAERTPVIAGRYTFEDLALKVTAFYFYNGYPARFLPCHLLLQEIANHDAARSSRKPSVPDVRKLIEEATRIQEQRGFTRVEERRQRGAGRPPTRAMDNLSEFETIRGGSASIVNPGTTGQMLGYVLDRFGPHEDQLRSCLGFGALEACRTARVIQLRLSAVLETVLERTTPADMGFVGPRHYRARLNAPTKEFIEAWELGVLLGNDDLKSLEELGLSKQVVGFMSANAPAFSSRGPSFARWAFLRRLDGKHQLVIPWILVDTLTSALHIGLLEKLSVREKGAYGKLRGKVFEQLVARTFMTAYPGVVVKIRAKSPAQIGDTDLLVDLRGDMRILVQCKGRLLRPIGKWSREEMFQADLERNIIDAASQARRALQALNKKPEVHSVFIVLDAYFAGASAFSFAGGTIETALEGLPRPVIISYYDLEYLLRRIPQKELREYLEWRLKVMRSRRFLLHDELDAVRLYMNKGVEVLREVEERQLAAAIIGKDPEFYWESIDAVDKRIFPHGLSPRDI